LVRHVQEVEKNIIEVSNIEIKVGDVTAENNVETEVGLIN